MIKLYIMVNKKFFLYGDIYPNVGPMNVNRSLVENADECMIFVKAQNKYLRRLLKIWHCVFHHTIVVSGGYFKPFELFLSKLLRKHIVYVMHGCGEYENIINKLNTPKSYLIQEQNILKAASVIVAVSKNYAQWVRRRYPQYANKIKYVNNGLEISKSFFEHEPHEDGIYTIAVSGGNRQIKCNLEVCKAVEKLVGEGMNIQVKAFGHFYDNGEPILQYPFVCQMNQMNKDEYYLELKKIDLYVVASDTETFGLVVGDGIDCGCSMLMSKNVGATCIFDKLSSVDLLDNNHDTDEIASKIKYLLLHSNARRLYDAVDTVKCSGKQAYLNLKQICLDE